MYKRSDKVAEAIHKLVSELLVRGLKDPRVGFVTVTDVKVTDDMRQATVYFSVVGNEAQRKDTEAGLNSARGFIRKELARGLNMRFTPEIRFKYDTSVEYGSHIDTILKEIGSRDETDNS